MKRIFEQECRRISIDNFRVYLDLSDININYIYYDV